MDKGKHCVCWLTNESAFWYPACGKAFILSPFHISPLILGFPATRKGVIISTFHNSMMLQTDSRPGLIVFVWTCDFQPSGTFSSVLVSLVLGGYSDSHCFSPSCWNSIILSLVRPLRLFELFESGFGFPACGKDFILFPFRTTFS